MRRTGVAVLRTEPWGNLARGRREGFWIRDLGPGMGFRESLPSRSPVYGCEAPAVHGRHGGGARIGCLNCGEVHRHGEHQALPLPAVGRQQHGSGASDDPAHRLRTAMRQPSGPFPLRWASLPTWHRRPRSTPRRPQARCANGSRRQARRSRSAAGPKSRPRVSRRAGLSGRESSRERPAAPLEPRCPRREKHCPAALRFHPVARLSLQRFHPLARLSLPPPHAGIPALLARATAHRLPQQTVDRHVPQAPRLIRSAAQRLARRPSSAVRAAWCTRRGAPRPRWRLRSPWLLRARASVRSGRGATTVQGWLLAKLCAQTRRGSPDNRRSQQGAHALR